MPGCMEVTIVMYHYVRDIDHSRYPEIKGLRVTEFQAQLEFLRAHYHVMKIQDVMGALRGGEPIPPRAAVLTFDDGYLDHYTNVFPLLHDAGLQGAFFPPVSAVERAELLDVNRAHFVLASAQDKGALVRAVDEFTSERRGEFGLEDPRSYWARWGRASRFDSAEVIYVKRMLQVGLPKSARKALAAELFRRYVSVDEAAFARELYMTTEQVAMMQRNGMYVGSHGDSHAWLDSLDLKEQETEIDSSLRFLRRIGSPVDHFWAIAYPYGAWNDSLLGVVAERGCALGLTTEVSVTRLGEHHALRLPRLDTNDFPKAAA
jgi:peptidoglycan/xylan/chitin deacetylase (PgdA/CDA1 family)